MKKLEDGTVTTTEEELVSLIGIETEKALIKAGLTKPASGLPGGAPEMDAPEKFAPVAGESETKRIIRLNSSLVAISGGRLRVEDAPKEIKLIRFLRAMKDGDTATVKALGEAGYQKALIESSAADGGNLIPIEFGTDLLVAIEDFGIMRRDSMVIPMNAHEKDLRTITTKPTISRKAETIAADEAGTKFGKPILTNDMYVGTQVVSYEELEDNNVNLMTQLTKLFGEQFAKAEDIEGLTGSYYPGVLKSVTPTTTTLDSNTVKDITYKKLVECKNSLSPGQLSRGGKWYMHRTVMSYLEGMVDNVNRPILIPAFGGQPTTLLGYPVELSEAMPDITLDAPDTPMIIFGNLRWVAFGDRQGITSTILREATLNLSGGGTINLASQRAIGLMIYIRWGVNVTIPGNLAVIRTHA